MKSFNFSKKFEQVTSLVLAIMLLLSVFTASNVAVFADTEDKNVKTKETQDQVDLYVKSSAVPCIKSSNESNYQVMSAYANGYYSAKVNKAGTAVSSPDSADKAKYQLADFTIDDSKVYFVKPADWNSSDIKAHFVNSNGKAYDIPMDSVSNSVFLKDSKSNTVSNLTLGNNEKLYSVTIPAGMTNVIFYYNNYEKLTNDIINISAGNCYKLTERTTENGTIFNAESIGSVGSLNKLNKSYSFSELTVIDFADLSSVKTLKMSDLKLKAGYTELSENSETVLEKSNDKFSVENAKVFDVKVYYNNTEITSVSDIKEYDKTVSLTVKLSDIPDMTKEYKVTVNSGLVIDGGKWQFNETDVTSIENNTFNVYAPSSEYPLSSGKEFEVTPKFEPKLKCNGESVNSGANVTYYNSNDEEIQKLEFVNYEFTNSNSKTLKYKVSYNNYTVTGEITVNCYFVSVALASSSGSFVDEDNKIVYQKDESCSYGVELDTNIKDSNVVNFSINNDANVNYTPNSKSLEINNLTKESELTIKYPTEDGFEVKTYTVIPDNTAPEITEIKFNSENAKSDDNGLYKNGDITFTIKLKDEDSGSGIYDGSLTGNDVFSYNFSQSENVFRCKLSDNTINGDTVFKITDRVGNKAELKFKELITNVVNVVYVDNTPITNNNFKVVSTTENGLSATTNFDGTNYGKDIFTSKESGNISGSIIVSGGNDTTGFASVTDVKCYHNDTECVITYDESTNEFTVPAKDTGTYQLSYTVTNKAGVAKDVSNTFYVDNTAPEITKVEFVKTTNPTVTDQILNFLTFGIYSNDTIVMNVTATDKAPTSGLPSDTITVKNGESVISGSSATADSNATDSSTVKYTYELGNSDSAYDLSFTVKDNANNVNENIALVDLVKDNKVKANDNSLTEEQLKNVSNVFEVVSNNEEDFKFTDTFTGADKKVYDDNDNIIRHGESINVTSQIEVSNKAGINNISNIECYYYNDDQKPENKVTVSADEKYDYSSKKTTSAEINFNITTKETGKYILKYTATNNAGVSKTNTKTFYVDNTAPEITNVEFVKTTNPTVTDQILNFLTFGIYSNDTIVMNVTATDNAPTSGLPSDAITVNGGGNLIKSATADSNATNSSTVTYSYELGNSDSAYDLSFTVKDNANNVNENIALADLVKDNKVKANDKSLTEEQLKNVSDVFEVVSSTKEPTAKVSSYKARGANAFNDNNIYHGDQLTVTLDLNNDISGLQSISDLSVRGFENSNFSNFKLTKFNGKDQSFTANSFDELAAEFKNQATNEKVKSATVTFDINIKDNPNYSESHKLSLTVTDNSGNSNSEISNSTFYVDNTAPEVTKVEFNKKDENSIDKILNFLTFGIYSNNTIVMKVTATDSAPTSGLPNDTIKVKNGETEIKAINPTYTAASNATQDSKVTYSFELGNSAQAYDLSFTVKDNAQNTLTKALKDLIKEGNTEFNKPEGLGDLNSDVFEVVSSTEEPTVKISYEAKGTDAFNDVDKNIYHGDTLTVTMDLENNISGLQTMSDLSVDNFDNTIDNTNLSNFKLAKVNDEEQITTFNTFNELVKNFENIAKKEKVTSATVMFDINISRNSEYSGKHTVELKVTDNSGNSNSEISNSTFYVDNTAPEVTKVEFNKKDENSIDKILNFLTFGIYSNDTIVMKVTATDSAPTSGFDNLTNAIKVVDANGNEISVTKVEKAASNATQESKVTYSFEIGNSAQAYNLSFMVKDNAGNTTDNITLTSIKNKNLGNDKYYEVFVENKDSHNLNEHINIDLPQTSVKDSNGKNLYKNDVNVNLTINDVYSGIARIDYTVKSDFDKNNEQQGTININDESKGSSVEDNNGVSWNINEKQNTRVTQASSTITVKNNSNNIKISVKLTDRAGNVSTKEQTLSIDKTNPTIKIEYDNNNHTSHNDTEFFKANRTATITVTERNFNPEDIDYKITNTDNVIPQISDWTKHAVAAGENPDGDTYTATIVYAADGDYTFDIAYTDMAGNKADTVAQHKFTIDKTIPVISVSFDNNSAKNNNYFKADRTATITVNEHNFNAADVKVNISATGTDNSTSATAPSVSSWTNNGNVHTATISFAKDGKYAFDVNYTDLADNAAKENVVTTFYVDKTAPTVKISNVVNESANSGNVAPVISLSDNNYSGDYVLSLTRVDINAKKTDVTNDFASTVVPTNNIGAVVTYANFASEEVNDGIYVLNATLTDKAGNSSADTITFSVNRFGSTYMGGDEETNALLDNGYTNAEKDIVISEINVDKLTKSNISLSLDSSSLKTLKQNVDYTIQEDAKTGQWHRYNYTVKSSNFENEGNYTLELSSTDAAKNTSTNRIRPVEKRKLAVQFVVDKTSPVVNIAGIENNALYEENSKDVTIVCEDSYINPSSLVINLDNKTLKEGKDYTVEKDVASITAKIKVNATSDISSQNIKVSVKDMAQNSGDGSVENFTLSATVLMRFFANPVLVIISAVILAGIIVMVVLIVAKKRKNN